MMVRFLLAVAVAATFAGGAAQAQAPAVQPPAATVPAPATATASVPAEQNTTTAPGRPVVVQPMTSAPAAGSLIQTILALCAVLGLLAVLAWFMKRYGPKAIAGSAHVRLVGALNLGGRERIMVVEVGDQWIVVGASPGRVNALATMPRQAAFDAATAANASLHPHQPPASSFAEWLKQTIDKRNAK
ncbi:flagellar biosynthetic protein FliO [Massilia eurypsychrophila]|jgi:flagellar protein FliO/FliZ|uniref:Flagellar protein n=1 Tax=Massilia eurypsychrophila TaxID=1485217 RepID=A0A2G8TBE6_9BURK|nr:flagellar biosynthetic protein FliO [Massilia eurypsychrophila]PIL43361.1 flagellar biosynthetic protein FliO [Massilia eurypsychrophila]